jgi:hypothetical protein
VNRNSVRRETFRWQGLVYWLPLLPFLARIGDFIYLRGSDFSDLAISHLPNLLYLREALIEYRTIPLWSPTILSGFPFFANPLSGLWYPPGWPAGIWPEPWAFNLLAGLHLVFGAYGMGRFLKSLGLRWEAQAFGGLAFGLMPKLLSHFAAGHITLVYAVAWMPWLLLAEVRPLRGWVRPSILTAVIFMADPRWGAYSGALWLAWAFYRRQGTGVWLRHAASETAVALLLSGPLLLPLVEYSGLSTRAALTSAETLAFSLPVANLLGLLFALPNAEFQLYPGAAALVLAAGVVLLQGSRKWAGFWVITAVFSLLFALGDSVPLLRGWAYLPLAGLLRVPSRALFVFGFSVIVLAANALERAAALAPKSDRFKLWIRQIVVFAGIWATIAFVEVLALRRIPMTIGSVAASAALFLFFNLKKPFRYRIALLFACVFLDLWLAMTFNTVSKSRMEIISDGKEAAAWLAEQPGSFRVYSPSYSLPQHTTARYGLALASGVDPLQLHSYANFMAAASGIPNSGYSIPLPPIDGDIETANRAAAPDTKLLGLLNVRYLATAFDLAADGLVLEQQFGETRVYRNASPVGIVWRLPDGPGGDPVPVDPAEYERTPNRIDLKLNEPGVYFISEVDYPGWQVRGAAELSPYRGVFRTFEVADAGAQVSLIFRPVSLYAGLGLLALGVMIVFIRQKTRCW